MSARPRAPQAGRGHDERGIALVMAIVVLLVVSILATMVMQNLSTERKISGHGLRTSRALSAAEAGVAEAVSRLRSGEIELDEENPAAVAQIFLTEPGMMPAVGTDTLSFATLQPSGSWLEYSSSTSGAGALTIEFRRDPDTGDIVRWDETQSPPFNTLTGMPVYRITSTGSVNGDRTSVVADVIRKPLHARLNAALTVGNALDLGTGIAICGFQHSSSITNGDGVAGRMANPTCTHHEVGRDDVPAVWTAQAISNNGATLAGLPAASEEHQAGFYSGPWEALGISSTDFRALLGDPQPGPASFDGVVWMDDNSTMNDVSGTFEIHDLIGEGLVYVDGDLTITGDITYRGLIYVEGDLTTASAGSVVGGVVVRGRSGGTTQLQSGPSILYSIDEIHAAIARATGDFVTLSWREVR